MGDQIKTEYRIVMIIVAAFAFGIPAIILIGGLLERPSLMRERNATCEKRGLTYLRKGADFCVDDDGKLYSFDKLED